MVALQIVLFILPHRFWLSSISTILHIRFNVTEEFFSLVFQMINLRIEGIECNCTFFTLTVNNRQLWNIDR